jgi:hypothetical protein
MAARRASFDTASCAGELKPGEVKYYKFTVPDKTAAGSTGNDRFYYGSYVPYMGEPGFTFFVTFFGMPNTTECERWGDGWGRRTGDHSHADPITANNGHTGAIPPHRVTAQGTTWISTSKVPERVVGEHATTPHTHEGFDYHKEAESLTFIASPHTDLPNKFEVFSPTLFKPRGSCIANFPRGGEYRIAVWGEEGQDRARRFSVGLGLAERDVYAVGNLVTYDYILYGIQIWNGWNGFVLILPIFVLGGIVAPLTLIGLRIGAPEYYGTYTGWATPYRGIVLVVSGIILGHMIINSAILDWAVSNSPEQKPYTFALFAGIITPLFTGLITLAIGLNIRAFFGPSSSVAGIGVRITTFLIGILHLFLHCGYIVGPVLLLVASLLPPQIADFGALLFMKSPFSPFGPPVMMTPPPGPPLMMTPPPSGQAGFWNPAARPW